MGRNSNTVVFMLPGFTNLGWNKNTVFRNNVVRNVSFHISVHSCMTMRPGSSVAGPAPSFDKKSSPGRPESSGLNRWALSCAGQV